MSSELMQPDLNHTAARRRFSFSLKRFLELESSAGIILVLAASLAFFMVNTPLKPYVLDLLDIPVEIRVGKFSLAKPFLLWINDGLMAIFFLLVGLEIKREVLEGQLSHPAQVALPAVAALGGMLMPALIYLAFTVDDPLAVHGWAIPSATDIAFSLGVLSLLGKRVPVSLKVFLTALAIFDDLGAIIIIAIFYTHNLSFLSLQVASVFLVGLFLLNRLKVASLIPYGIMGILLWASVLKSGVHATLAGVVLALFIPMRIPNRPSPLLSLEHALHPWVSFAILPLFGFANAGVDLRGMSINLLFEPVTLGIVLGLFIGKQLGIFLFTWKMIYFGFAKMPQGATWKSLYGISMLAGIGFTMSLFIGSLAFNDSLHRAEVRIGVIVGSLLSAICGFLWLKLTSPSKDEQKQAKKEAVS